MEQRDIRETDKHREMKYRGKKERGRESINLRVYDLRDLIYLSAGAE